MKYEWKTVAATIRKEDVSDIDRFFVNHNNAYTTYWFATGERPRLSLEVWASVLRTQKVIAENVYNRRLS